MGDTPNIVVTRQDRIETSTLPPNIRKYLVTHILDELRRDNWKRQTRAAGLLATGQGGAGRAVGSRVPGETQRYTELVARFLVCTVHPEPELGMAELDLYGIVLSDHALAQLLQDLTAEPGDADLYFTYFLNQLEMGIVRRPWYYRRPKPHEYRPEGSYYRNPKVSELAASTAERLLDYCDVIKAPEVVARRYFDELDEMTAPLITPEIVFALEIA